MNTKKVGNIFEIIIYLVVLVSAGSILNIFYPNFTDQPVYILVKDSTTFILTIFGLYVAKGGLFTWKRQIEYNKKDEAANSLHFSLLKLRDAIKHVRNPAIFPSEQYKAVQYFKSKYPNETETERNTGYVYEMRWEEITNALTEMEFNLLRTEVLWGSEIRKLVKPLYSKITELNIALKQNFDPGRRTNKLTEIHDVMYDQGDWTNDKEDDFGESVNKVIMDVVSYMNSKIS